MSGKRINAVIYARYSSDSQRDASIDGQIRVCRDYANREGYTVIGEYIDRAKSARNANRDDFQRMIADSEKRLFDVVLVYKLDRFSRDRYDTLYYKKLLKNNGVRVVSATEYISPGSDGIVVESMLVGYAEYYSAELSEKIHRGQKENALQGKNNGGGVPLGYALDSTTQTLKVDPITAPLVVEIYERFISGETLRSIADDFNARGIRTSTGTTFNKNSFHHILRNRKYIGEYRYQDVFIPDAIPKIVPEDLFNSVQERIEKNRKAPAHTKAKEVEFLLTSKLRCGKCEALMVGESGRSKTGTMYYYYKCTNAKRKKTCDKKPIKKDWIERIVVELTMARVLNEEQIDRIIDALLRLQEREDVTLPPLKKQLKEAEKSINNLLKAIEAGIITSSTKERLISLENQKETLLTSIETAKLQQNKLTKKQMEQWFSQFCVGNPEDQSFRRNLIDTFVNSVYVYDDKIVLTYNYHYNTQTIALSEVEEYLGSDLDRRGPPAANCRPQ